MKIAILGLGEAGSHFANDLLTMGVDVSGWDPHLTKTLHKEVMFARDNPEAVQEADIIFSVNYASESESIAKEVAPFLKPWALYCEMNTSSPKTKINVETILKPTQIQFVDVAIMGTVPSKGMLVPLLVSGSGAQLLIEKLKPLSLNITYLNDKTGDAAGRKLLRSIVYKGVAAVLCEASEAGKHFGLEDYMRTQIHNMKPLQKGGQFLGNNLQNAYL